MTLKYVTVAFFVLSPLKLSAQQAGRQTSRIQIRLDDRNSATPLAGAVVTVDAKNSAQADENGKVSFDVALGIHTLQVRSVGFQTATKRITVGAGRVPIFRIGMEPSVQSLGGVTVEARRNVSTEKSLLLMRRRSANIQDAISQEQISRSASLNTAQALQKVTGVTLRDGKYITVRGLTDRNLVIELNGARLAGADASRSAVALDLIPAPLLDNIVVQKSVTADKPGDANGAVIEIKTRSIPDSAFLSFTLQEGFNGNIGLGGYTNGFQGDRIGFAGFQVKNQNVPASYNSLVTEYEKRGGYQVSRSPNLFRADLLADIDKANTSQSASDQAAKINRAMRSFDPVLSTRPEIANVNQLYVLSFGNRFQINKKHLLGAVAGINYYNRYSSNSFGQINRYSINEVAAVSPNIIKPNETQLIDLFKYRENTGIHALSWGGFATASYQFNKSNEVSFTYDGSYGAETNTTSLTGTNNAALSPAAPSGTPTPQVLLGNNGDEEFSLRTTQRALHSLQLRGEHAVKFSRANPTKISWSLSRGFANQNDPDYRDTRIFYDSLGRVFSELRNFNNVPISGYSITYNALSDRYYRRLNENNLNAKVDVLQSFKVFHPEDVVIKVGANFYGRKRSFREIGADRSEVANVIGFLQPGQDVIVPDLATKFYQLSPLSYLTRLRGDLDTWSKQTTGIISSGALSEGTGPIAGNLFVPRDNGFNSYNATYNIAAFYGMTDLTLIRNWRLVAGVRVENTDLQAKTDTSGVNIPSSVTTQPDFDNRYRTDYLTYIYLPSGSLIYNGIRNTNLRLAYSKTVQRPELNEAINTSQFDVLQQAVLIGNNRLKNGQYSSFDVRIDYFPSAEELVSGSFFYKEAKDVLERVFFPNRAIDPFGRSVDTITYRNNPNSGTVIGIELDFRKRLSKTGFFKNLSLAVNFFAAKSTTRITNSEYFIQSTLDRDAPRNRPLIDQANYSTNLSLSYDNLKQGTIFSVLYNKTGKRLVQISSDGSPNVYEFPAGSLDVVLSQKLFKRMTLKAFGKNVLNEINTYYYTGQGFNSKPYGQISRTYLQRAFGFGAEYSLGVNYLF